MAEKKNGSFVAALKSIFPPKHKRLGARRRKRKPVGFVGSKTKLRKGPPDLRFKDFSIDVES